MQKKVILHVAHSMQNFTNTKGIVYLLRSMALCVYAAISKVHKEEEMKNCERNMKNDNRKYFI